MILFLRTRIARRLLIGCVCALSVVSAVHADQVLIGAAGVPRNLGEARDYDRIFDELKKAGIALFLPTSVYQISPEAKSLGREADFLPPCSPNTPALAALRRSGIKLVIPASLLYSAKGDLPPLDADPLRQLIACVGRTNLFGLSAFDEPALQDLPVIVSAHLYERVKAIDPTLPVLMVQAPLKPLEGQHTTPAGRDAYLRRVIDQSQFADIVGFDLYAIPKSMARIGTPESGGLPGDYASAARDYFAWLKHELPDKRYLAVLQAFSYADQYEPSAWRDVEAKRLGVRPPAKEELSEMVRLSVAGGAEIIFWWGQSLLPNDGAQLWRDVIAVSKSISSN